MYVTVILTFYTKSCYFLAINQLMSDTYSAIFNGLFTINNGDTLSEVVFRY